MIAKDPELISKLQHYKNQYNWNGPEFQLAIKKTGKFEKNKPDITVNKLFDSNKGIYIQYADQDVMQRVAGKQSY